MSVNMVANVPFTTFATGLFLEQTYVWNTFALCKFNLNPFFRPVIAVIAVAPAGKASFVYSYVQTRLKCQYNKTADNCDKSYSKQLLNDNL